MFPTTSSRGAFLKTSASLQMPSAGGRRNNGISRCSGSPCRKAVLTSPAHKAQQAMGLPKNFPFRPAIKIAKTRNSDCLVGVALSLCSVQRSGSLHPTATMRHFGRSGPTPRDLSRKAALERSTRLRSFSVGARMLVVVVVVQSNTVR